MRDQSWHAVPVLLSAAMLCGAGLAGCVHRLRGCRNASTGISSSMRPIELKELKSFVELETRFPAGDSITPTLPTEDRPGIGEEFIAAVYPCASPMLSDVFISASSMFQTFQAFARIFLRLTRISTVTGYR
jgi:hypothetical protein